MTESVLATGAGIVSSIGGDVPQFTSSLREGKSGISLATCKAGALLPVKVRAALGEFSFRDSLNHRQGISDELRNKANKVARRSPLPVQVSTIALLEAWEQAELESSPVAADRIGIVVGGQNTTQNYQYQLHETFRESPEYLSPRYALQFLETDQVGVLSDIFNIRGEGLTVGGASASGNVAVVKAQQLIQLGLVDVCVVVGVLADLSPMDIQGFQTIGAMGGRAFATEPEKACRPFDRQHEGFVYGKAGACLILESAESARKRGVHVQAEVLAGSICLSANSSSEPCIDGEVRAMEQAIQRAGIDKSAINYINTHGSSSPLGDKIEAEAIERVFGANLDHIKVNATKGLTGHCLYSAGLVEVVATLAQIEGGFVHPNKNLEDPVSEKLNFCGDMAQPYSIQSAVCNSYGFGGFNSSIVLRAV